MVLEKESTPKISVGPRTDRVGKLFLVIKGGMRRCLVCEHFFTNHEAAEHSRVPCGPRDRGVAKFDDWRDPACEIIAGFSGSIYRF